MRLNLLLSNIYTFYRLNDIINEKLIAKIHAP